MKNYDSFNPIYFMFFRFYKVYDSLISQKYCLGLKMERKNIIWIRILSILRIIVVQIILILWTVDIKGLRITTCNINNNKLKTIPTENKDANVPALVFAQKKNLILEKFFFYNNDFFILILSRIIF